MEKVIIDGLKMTSKEVAHSYLANHFNFPPYYGRNLDALFDCLVEITASTLIYIVNERELITNLGEYGRNLINTIVDATKENDSLILVIDKKEE
jgi:ribonuclease inhibitor